MKIIIIIIILCLPCPLSGLENHYYSLWNLWFFLFLFNMPHIVLELHYGRETRSTSWITVLELLYRRSRIFFIILYNRDKGKNFIMLVRHNQPVKSHTILILFFNNKFYYFSTFYSLRLGGLVSLENLCPPRHEPLHQHKKKITLIFLL